MSKPKMIGTMNARIETQAKCGKVEFTHDGTIKGMVLSAIRVGLRVGDVIVSRDFGTHRLVSAPHDDRCNGLWADRIWA